MSDLHDFTPEPRVLEHLAAADEADAAARHVELACFGIVHALF
jgi:hypothetical protein